MRVILGGGCVCGVVGLVCFLPSAGGGHVIVLGVEHLGMGDQSACRASGGLLSLLDLPRTPPSILDYGLP